MSHWSPLLAAGRSVWRCCRATLPVYVLLAAVAGNPAAARAASPGLADGSDDYSSSSPAGVVLPLSLSAESELAAAARLMRRGQWEQSLPILQGLLETDGDRVIRDGKTYVPVADLVNRRLASAPEAAQGVYNLLYGPLAERLYQQAVRERSASMLADVARRYLNTRFGPLAISMLASLRMDEERPASALIALRRADILRLGAAAAKPIATKKILCLARLNRRADAQRIVRNLREDGITHLTVGGIEWEADALLQEAFARLRPLGPPAAENSWPVLGGNAAGSRAPALFAPDALFPLSASLPWPARAEADGPSLPSTRPVASRDALFVNRDGTIFALDRRSLRAKWVALAPETAAEVLLGLLEHEPPRGEYLGSHLGMGNVHHWRTFDNHGLATLSVSEGRLFAVRVEPSRLRIPAKPWAARPAQVELANELSCYDAEHGSVLWRVGGGTLQPKGPLDECWFFTAPTVSRGQAYVLAARTGHLYALCLDAASGRLIWKSRIGAMEARQEVQRYAMQFFLADTAPPAVADGIAIFPTGQGLVCAYDAIDGSLLWAAEYPRADVWISRLGERINVPAGPWHPRQPLLQGGLCLLTPMDSRHLVALSIRTGAAVWQAEFPHGTALLGALDGRAYVQHAGVTCLDLRSGQAVWEAAEASRPVGIGALGRETVYVPERTCIRRLHVSSGEEQDALPWPPGAATAGNLLLLDDSLVACSPEQLTVCMPPDGALGLAGTRVAIAPGSPDPLLVRGMLRAWHGDASGAVGDFESALALAEGPADANGAARVRRQTAISLAGLAVKSKMAKLLVRASDAAPDEPAVHAELAVARLRLALSQAGGEDVVDTYLNLCREFGMLACAGPLGPASVWTQLAETVRRECADRPDLADQWRAQMDALIQQGAADGNVAVLADLARWAAFPQGRTAALMLLGTTLEQQGELDKARRAFAQVAASTARPEQRAEARTWLQRLSARPEGIRAESEEASACKLEFIPTAKAQWSVPGLLLQPEGAEPAALQGNVLVLENDVLKRVDASNGVLAWAADLPGEAQAAWRSGAGYPLYCAPGSGGVVVTRGVLFGVDLRSGQVAWHRAFTAPRRYVRTVPIPRGELIQRAHRGLPVPPHGTAVRAARVESLICGPTLVCELRKD
ncbi:MAG: outer membrane protein assembly factor BamB family protein, partial [Planctomycetota bacterium]